MPILEFRSRRSQTLLDEIEHSRGSIPHEEFLMRMIVLGLARYQPTVWNETERYVSEPLGVTPRAIELQDIEPAPPPNVATFGTDVTKPAKPKIVP